VTTPPPLPPAPQGRDDALDVYVLPMRRGGYELFCERQGDEESAAAEPAQPGIWGRLVSRFGVMLRAAEDQEAGADPKGAEYGWLARVQRRMLAWMAERVAEQRLLWRLRGKARVVASHPDDVSFEEVLPIAHRLLRSDYERHRRWLVVDVIALIVSGVLALVPGPNVLAYFFAFRVVGHWLSMRGAQQGLRVAAWSGRPCPELTRLRGVVDLPPTARAARLHEVAARLGLERLPRFVERMAMRR
jgi:hypothetical protein